MPKSNRERSADYHAKTKLLRTQLEQLREALATACEKGRSHRLMDNLPDDPGSWLPELTERLTNRAIVVFRREA